jgi:hypothetical protein
MEWFTRKTPIGGVQQLDSRSRKPLIGGVRNSAMISIKSIWKCNPQAIPRNFRTPEMPVNSGYLQKRHIISNYVSLA